MAGMNFKTHSSSFLITFVVRNNIYIKLKWKYTDHKKYARQSPIFKLNIPASVFLLSGDWKPQIRF